MKIFEIINHLQHRSDKTLQSKISRNLHTLFIVKISKQTSGPHGQINLVIIIRTIFPCTGGPLMYLNTSVSRYTLIGTVNGQGYDCRTDTRTFFEERDDGMWNKVSEHMEWIEKTMREFEQPICKA